MEAEELEGDLKLVRAWEEEGEVDRTYLEDLRSIDGYRTITRQCLIDLSHDCEHGRMELSMARCKHILVGDIIIFLF